MRPRGRNVRNLTASLDDTQRPWPRSRTNSGATPSGSTARVDARSVATSAAQPATRYSWMGCAGVAMDWGPAVSTRFYPAPNGNFLARDKARQDQQGQEQTKQAATAPGCLPNGRPGFQPGPASGAIESGRGRGGDPPGRCFGQLSRTCRRLLQQVLAHAPLAAAA